MSTPSRSRLQRFRELLLPGRAPVTTLMMLFCLGWWMLLALQTGDIGRFGVSSLLRAGANYTPFSLHGEPWRLLAYAWLHGGILHLAMNLYALHVVGGMVEGRFGSARYAVLYIVAALGAGLASALGTPLAPSVGASGAILGVVGAGAVAGHLMGNRIGEHIRNQLLVWFLIIMGIGIVGDSAGLRFDNWAHAGGFVTGALLGGLFHLVERRWRHASLAEGVLAVVIVGSGLVSAITPWVLYRDLPVVSDQDGVRAAAAQARAWNACSEALRQHDLDAALTPCRNYRLVDFGRYRGYVVMALLQDALERPLASRHAHGALRTVHATGAGLEPSPPEEARRMLLELLER